MPSLAPELLPKIEADSLTPSERRRLSKQLTHRKKVIREIRPAGIVVEPPFLSF